jgi:hypothetical protein
MVDFPEGYGFEPNGKAKLMQESFLVDIGVFTRGVSGWVKAGRNRSPYHFRHIGYVRKENNEMPLRGILFNEGLGVGPPIEGTLQQVVTALCTLHRMRGHMK